VQTAQTCGRHQLTTINGALKIDDSSYSNGLVAIQIKRPDGDTMTLRTVNTGANPSNTIVDIKNVSSTDFNRNPVSNVATNSLAYFTVYIENKAATTQPVTYYINIYDNLNTPIAHTSGSQVMQPNSIISSTVSVEIPSWAANGRATVFASAFTTLPDANGVPYCPEKSSTFTVNGQQGVSPPTTPNGNQGSYSLELRIPRNSPLGQYTVIVSSASNGVNAFSSTNLEVYQLGDLYPSIDGDGVVNSDDIASFVNSYIKYYGGFSYDTRADMNHDGTMNSDDISAFVNAYIIYYSWG
jgi:hypothetical protein